MMAPSRVPLLVAREPLLEREAGGVAPDAGITFGELLRRYRTAAGLTQEELAARAGLTPQGISLLERGERRHPQAYTVRQLAAHYLKLLQRRN